MTAKQREQRLVKLTMSEMASLPDDAVVYEGVGKMYVSSPAPLDLVTYTTEACTNRGSRLRFASLPVTTLRQKLERQAHDLEGEVGKLNQRLLYLETTHKNSREHIEQMLRSQ